MGLSRIAIIGGTGLLATTMLPLMCTPATNSKADVQLLAAGVCVYGWPSTERAVATIRAAHPDQPLSATQWEQWDDDAGLDEVELAEATATQIDRVLHAAVDDILARNQQLLVAVPTEWVLGEIPGDDDPAWTTPLADGTVPSDYISNWLNLYAVDPTVLAAAEAAGVQDCASEGRLYQACADDSALDTILATIRQIETGGDYRAQSTDGTASGAYLLDDDTWASHAGYTRAGDAPGDVQDAKARTLVQLIIDRYGTELATIPVAWYLPAAAEDDVLMDLVPDGRQLTPRQYQARWLDRYRIEANTAGIVITACGVATSPDGTFALPLPRAVLSPARLIRTHHDYPAIDISVPVGTPLYAPATGRVAKVYTTTYRWANTTCSPTPVNKCEHCGVGVLIGTDSGFTFQICHMSRNDLRIGQEIVAGEPIGLSGNTGHSTGPHLHFGINKTGADGFCPQTFLMALYNGNALPSLESLPTSGCTH